VIYRWLTSLLIVVVALGAACGGRVPPPKRRVIEVDVAGWRFRRYQEVVDVEVYVDGNPARAHTASYVRDAAVKAGRLNETDVVSAFVTEYSKTTGVTPALIRFARRLAQESGYRVEERRLGGERILQVTGHGETWAFWPSGRYVVKVGGHGPTEVPSGLVEEYGRRYPSRLAEGALDRAIEEESKVRGGRP
jgi:hypothetical protein